MISTVKPYFSFVFFAEFLFSSWLLIIVHITVTMNTSSTRLIPRSLCRCCCFTTLLVRHKFQQLSFTGFQLFRRSFETLQEKDQFLFFIFFDADNIKSVIMIKRHYKSMICRVYKKRRTLKFLSWSKTITIIYNDFCFFQC